MNLSPLPIQKFFDNNGRPLVGGLLFTYEAGTPIKTATYIDSSGGTPNTNPIVLDFRGECRIWIEPLQSYKFVLSPPGDSDPPANAIWTVDNITAGPPQEDNAAVDAGSVNNISLTIPQLSAPVAFTRIVFQVAHTNTGAVTISINGGASNPLVLQSGEGLARNTIYQDGIYQAIFDGANWQWQGALKNVSGSWTASILGSVTAGTYEISSQFCSYTRIGNRVWLDFFIQMAAVITGGGAGVLLIRGAPFAKRANSFPLGGLSASGMDLDAGAIPSITFETTAATSDIVIRQSFDNAPASNQGISSLSATDLLIGSICYETEDE